MRFANPSSTTSIRAKAVTLAQMQALISGLQKRFPSGQFTLENTEFTTATLVQALQSLVDAIVAVNTAQATAKAAVATLGVTAAKVGPIAMALKRTLLSMFGTATTALVLFGLEPRKAPAPRTGLQNATAAAKAAATRLARGTVTPASPPAQLATATPTAPLSGTAGR
ncbi:MAG TPA: hypothetical protein VGL81_09670 [Polyangiaceae bacterium]